MPIHRDPSVSEVADAVERAINEGTLPGVLSRSWGGRSGAATGEMFVVSEGEETVVVSKNHDSGHTEVRSLYPSDTLGPLGRKVQNITSEGQLP